MPEPKTCAHLYRPSAMQEPPALSREKTMSPPRPRFALLINPFYPGPLRGRSRGRQLSFPGRHPLRRRGGREGHGSERRSRAADNRASEAGGSGRRHGRPVSGWRILGLRGLLLRTPDFGSGRLPGGRFRAARRFHLAEKEGQKLTREVGIPGGPPRMTAGRRFRGPE